MLGVIVAVLLGVGACRKNEPEPAREADAGVTTTELGPELAGKVLAQVGDRKITLGDYAATIQRMDQFERLRYQSPERRQALLDEMINVELLAEEARRRGLDKRPEVQERVRQALRDELREQLRERVPRPEALPESEVRAYYEAHRSEFHDPERRRVAHIVMSDARRAEQVLERARGASPSEWGQLVHEFSLAKPAAAGPTAPAELAGDLGIVSAPGASRGSNPDVPEPVRQAVFQIEKQGGVYGELVKVGQRFHIVRLLGKTEARQRTYAEAERAIRVALVQQKWQELQAQYEQELRRKFPVTVDEKALEGIQVPPREGSDVHGQ